MNKAVVSNCMGPTFQEGDKPICRSFIYRCHCIGFRIILRIRIQPQRDYAHPKQNGLRPGRGCSKQLQKLRHILEQRTRFQQAAVMCCVDFASAFDLVDRDSYGECLLQMECHIILCAQLGPLRVHPKEVQGACGWLNIL